MTTEQHIDWLNEQIDNLSAYIGSFEVSHHILRTEYNTQPDLGELEPYWQAVGERRGLLRARDELTRGGVQA